MAEISTNDPITFAVLKSAVESIVDDMAYTVMRTARSPIVRDVLDYSTTMCDSQGRILAQAKTVALHLGALLAYGVVGFWVALALTRKRFKL